MNVMKLTGAVLLSLSCIAGCSSSTEENDQDVDTKGLEPKVQTSSCSTTYSDVVAAYIDYAPWHCEGWTGKVFCEYESLSSVYGPGWGQCQCYNTVCEPDVDIEQGRRCGSRRCY